MTATPSHSTQALEELVIERQVGLIVIDSIAAIMRREFTAEGAAARIEQLGALGHEAQRLKQLAELYRLQVVLTNQIASSGASSASPMRGDPMASAPPGAGAGMRFTAALGRSWAHYTNTRLVLEHMVPNTELPDHLTARRITIAKSPQAPVHSFAFTIDNSGLLLLQREPLLSSFACNNFWTHSIEARSAMAPGVSASAQHAFVVNRQYNT